MDRIDRNILKALQADASIKNNDLADLVGLAPSSCLRRVRALRKSGVILRTVALTDPEKMGRNLKVIVTVKLEDHGAKARAAWLKLLDADRTVSQVYAVSGDTDVVVVLVLANMKEFQEVSEKLFGSDPNVLQFQSLFVLNEYKFDLAL